MIPELEPNRETDIQEGDILCGRYRADRLIERSETGVVVEATDMLRGDSVAVKMVEPTLEETEMLAARLRREAHVLAQLTSPHVVRVLDVEKHGRAVCIVMELLRGSNLAQLARKRGPLPIAEAVGLIVQACDGLAEAHAIGIVHRDIKPQNLFLADRPDGTQILKVLDFGVSKQAGGGMGLTATGAAVGSPLYTAVEQFKDASRVDARADIWSVGLVLYFLLCRRNAFDGDNTVALMLKIATAQPVPLRERRPDVPPDLEAVILQCVEKNRDMRFRNVAALARALVPFGPPWAEGFLPSIEARLQRRPLQSLPPVSAAGPAAPASGPASTPHGMLVVPRAPNLPNVAYGAPPSSRQGPSNVPVAPAAPPRAQPPPQPQGQWGQASSNMAVVPNMPVMGSYESVASTNMAVAPGTPSYGPPSYGPPGHGTPSYGPPGYGPPSYAPPGPEAPPSPLSRPGIVFALGFSVAIILFGLVALLARGC